MFASIALRARFSHHAHCTERISAARTSNEARVRRSLASAASAPSHNRDNAMAQFVSDGYAVLPNFASAAELASLKAEAARIIERFDPSETRSIFSTYDQSRTSDQYFMESGDKVRCFFEEDALDKEGRLRHPKQQCINKIGHALHTQSEPFRRFLEQTKVRELATAAAKALHYRGFPQVVQTMYICKSAKLGGRVAPHQDNAFVRSDPLSTFGLWLAIDDARLDNGCMWAMPGSHKEGVKRAFVRTASGGTEFIPPKPTPADDWDENDPRWVPLEAKAGTAVLLHGTLVHMSKPNTNASSNRHAFTAHIVDSAARWTDDNWLQPPQFLPLVVRV